MNEVIFNDLGGIDYQSAWDFQQQLMQNCIANKLKNRELAADDPARLPPPHHLLFCEHPPVFTLGRSGSLSNLLLSESEMEARGIQFFPINRGGDITFHGPGQLVGYPILDLDFFFNDVHRYVRFLEEIFIRTLADFGIESHRIDGFTGVWVSGRGRQMERKICAIGVHMSRWVTLHGWAFNVSTDLDFFRHIIPCGIVDADKTVTSLEIELGMKVDMNEVKSRVKRHFSTIFDCKFI